MKASHTYRGIDLTAGSEFIVTLDGIAPPVKDQIHVSREAGAPPYWEWNIDGWHGGYAFTRWGARLAARRYLRARGR